MKIETALVVFMVLLVLKGNAENGSENQGDGADEATDQSQGTFYYEYYI